jgi:hypothetical protein
LQCVSNKYPKGNEYTLFVDEANNCFEFYVDIWTPLFFILFGIGLLLLIRIYISGINNIIEQFLHRRYNILETEDV